VFFIRVIDGSGAVGLGGHSPSFCHPCTIAGITTERLIGTTGGKLWVTTLAYIKGYIGGVIRERAGSFGGRSGGAIGSTVTRLFCCEYDDGGCG